MGNTLYITKDGETTHYSNNNPRQYKPNIINKYKRSLMIKTSEIASNHFSSYIFPQKKYIKKDVVVHVVFIYNIYIYTDVSLT